MTRIDSSAIAAEGYERRTRTLRLEYTNGRTYEYLDVPPEIHRALRKAESVGEFVNLVIKPNYKYREIG